MRGEETRIIRNFTPHSFYINAELCRINILLSHTHPAIPFFVTVAFHGGVPSVIILAISLLVALRVGTSFEQCTFAACISFVVCAMFLSVIYYTIFQSLPLSIYSMWEGKHTTEVEAEESKPSEAIEVQETE